VRRSDNLLEPSGTVKVCPGIAVPLPLPLCKRTSAKLTSEESIKEATHLDRVGVQERLEQSKHHCTRH